MWWWLFSLTAILIFLICSALGSLTEAIAHTAFEEWTGGGSCNRMLMKLVGTAKEGSMPLLGTVSVLCILLQT